VLVRPATLRGPSQGKCGEGKAGINCGGGKSGASSRMACTAVGACNASRHAAIARDGPDRLIAGCGTMRSARSIPSRSTRGEPFRRSIVLDFATQGPVGLYVRAKEGGSG